MGGWLVQRLEIILVGWYVDYIILVGWYVDDIILVGWYVDDIETLKALSK
jgi:hypothetical protein